MIWNRPYFVYGIVVVCRRRGRLPRLELHIANEVKNVPKSVRDNPGFLSCRLWRLSSLHRRKINAS